MNAERKALLQIHACVVLWGFTAILGKLISLPAAALVWWRMLIVAMALLLLPRVWRALRAMPPRLLAIYAGIGVVVALHWLTFYGAIKLANASVAATCMALGSVFAAVLEPKLTGRRMSWRELALGLAAIPGVALVVGGIDAGMRVGFAVGVVSAALTAVFTVMNKRWATRSDALAVTWVEMVAGWLFVWLCLPLVALLPAADASLSLPDARDGALLLVLALACTVLPFALSLVALRQVSAFSMQLALNLEPVYAIALAIVLLGEHHELSGTFYLGVAIVLAAVFVQPLLGRRDLHPAPTKAPRDGG
jgi:drug/metabolite transporter (DMT)-like permease